MQEDNGTNYRKRCQKRWETMKVERSGFMSHWKELAQYNEPRIGRFVGSERGNKGSKKNQKIIDSTARYALRTLGTGMLHGMTSPARPWFRLTLEDREKAEFAPNKLWLQMVQVSILDMFRKSNLYSTLPRIYREEGLFGTAALSMQDDDKTLFRFYPYTVGSYCIAQDHRQVVDTLYREVSMQVGSMAKEFGQENLTPSSQNLLKKDPDSWVPVMHCTEPNTERETGRKGNKNMEFNSIWYETGCDNDKILKRSGYEEFPHLVPRWDLGDDDVYGSDCPGMTVLGDNKQLQKEQKDKAHVIDKVARPPMNAPGSMRGKRVSQIPGEVNFVDTTQGSQRLEPAIDMDARAVGMIREDIVDIRQRIKKGFYEDLFMAITEMEGIQPRNNFEIQERKEEKFLVLGDVVERNTDDMLDGMIDRAFNMMMRQSQPIWAGLVDGIPLLPPPPDDLMEEDIKIEHISMLAQNQKAVGTLAMEQTIEFASNLAAATQSMDPFDKINTDKAIDEYAEAKGAPIDIIRTDDEVKARRDTRNQQAQQAMAMEQAQTMAAVAKDAGGISSEPGTVAGDVLTGAAQQ